MKVVPFIAETPAAALEQIHESLGPEAVVLSIRPVHGRGLARLWQKPHAVEVLACVLEESDQNPDSTRTTSNESQRPDSLNVAFLSQGFAPALDDGTSRPHVFIGPPGAGKTTLLCKWMTLSTLNENRSARVWRLDGPTANTAEFLNIYGEMLGITVERFWDPSAGSTAKDLFLVDIPGVQPTDRDARQMLRDQLSSLPEPRIHLVLNAAYESAILVEQFRLFSVFHPEDLSLTHLDEERDQARLLDFIQGTNCCLRFLSTGQKIPGDLVIAGADSRRCPEFAS